MSNPSGKARPHPLGAFVLRDEERALLFFYRVVPLDVRLRVGALLYRAWARPETEAEQAAYTRHYRREMVSAGGLLQHLNLFAAAARFMDAAIVDARCEKEA